MSVHDWIAWTLARSIHRSHGPAKPNTLRSFITMAQGRLVPAPIFDLAVPFHLFIEICKS
jgi:hypothetical protein